jgi:hypothetical protein
MKKYEYNGLQMIFFNQKEYDEVGGDEETLILDELWGICDPINSIKEFLLHLTGETDSIAYLDEFEWSWVKTKKVFDFLCAMSDSVTKLSDGTPVDPEQCWFFLDINNIDDDLVSLEEPILISFESYNILFYYSFTADDNLFAVPRMKLMKDA